MSLAWQAELLLPQSGNKFCIFLQDMFYTSVLYHWGWLGSRAGWAPSSSPNAKDLCKKATRDRRQLPHSWHSASRAKRQSDLLGPLFIAFSSYLKLPFCYWEQQQQTSRSMTGNTEKGPEDRNLEALWFSLFCHPEMAFDWSCLRTASCSHVNSKFNHLQQQDSHRTNPGQCMRQCFSSVFPSGPMTREGMSKQEKNGRWKLKWRQRSFSANFK